jgi:hypothetical protein
VQADADADEVIDSLNAAIDEARWKLEFYCTCRFRAAWGTSREEALAKLQRANVVQGVMARKGELFRAAGRSQGSGNWPDNFECVESPTLQLTWYGGASGNRRQLEAQPVRIARTPRVQSGLERLLYSCPTFHLDPLNEGGWRTGRVLERIEPTPDAQMRVSNTVERPDADHLIVQMEVYRNTRLVSRSRATFGTRYKPPALVRLETFTDDRDVADRPAANSLLEASRFVEVTGGWLPSRLLLTGGPYVLNKDEPPQWLASEWVSDDLGRRPPTAEDFVVTIPEQVEVVGLKEPPPLGKVRRLAITSWHADDLDERKEEPVVPRRTPRAPGSAIVRTWLTLLGIIAMAGIAGLIWRARLRRRGP